MVFSRFFKGGDRPDGSDATSSDASDDVADDVADELGTDDADVDPEDVDEIPWAERASHVLAAETSTGSKRAAALWGGPADGMPTHYVRANGATITTVDDDELIDCTSALGAVSLGYASERVTQSVVAATAAGNVAGLPHYLEVEVAEWFCEAVPCAERVQFLKSGAEAVAAAVRVARTVTGRTRVVGCGYFGWLDWCSTEAGVPASVRNDYVAVPFDDVAALEAAVAAAGTDLAAIVLEPVVERVPSAAWLERARALATAAGAMLVFDELKTGFRLATGGYQEICGVTPDLAAFGKALANGFPLAAVCGSVAAMDGVRRTWISSTLAGETVGLAAARAVLMAHQEEPVCEQLARNGAALRSAVGNALRASRRDDVTVEGPDAMWFLRFAAPDAESRFVRAAVRHGVLLKRGPYNFASLAHDEAVAHEVEARVSNALVALREEDGA